LEVEIISGNDISRFTARVTLENFSLMYMGDESLADGILTIEFRETTSATSLVFRSPRFDITENDESATLSDYRYELLLTPTTAETDGHGGLESSEFDGLVYFDITTDFVITTGEWPISGQMLIYGENNKIIRVTALPNGIDVRIELDLTGAEAGGGDGTYETDYTISWAALLEEVI
jgi:hypothetical protein